MWNLNQMSPLNKMIPLAEVLGGGVHGGQSEPVDYYILMRIVHTITIIINFIINSPCKPFFPHGPPCHCHRKNLNQNFMRAFIHPYHRSQVTLPISGLHYWYSFVTYRMHPEASSSVSSSHITKIISCIAITRLYRNFQIFHFNFVHVTLSCIGICTVYNNDWTILFKLQYLIMTRESI